jgi:hypothetical protein
VGWWILSYRLKGNRLWSLKCTADCAWYWKKLLKLRGLVWDQIHYIAGNGRTIHLWWDHWHSSGVLVKVMDLDCSTNLVFLLKQDWKL